MPIIAALGRQRQKHKV
jgi:hypothetical protein